MRITDAYCTYVSVAAYYCSVPLRSVRFQEDSLNAGVEGVVKVDLLFDDGLGRASITTVIPDSPPYASDTVLICHTTQGQREIDFSANDWDKLGEPKSEASTDLNTYGRPVAPSVATTTPPSTTAPPDGEQTDCPTSAELTAAYRSLNDSQTPTGWDVIGCADGYTLAAPTFGKGKSDLAEVFQQDGSRLNALGGGTLNNAPGTVENACSLVGVPATTAAKLGCPESPETANPAPNPKVLDEPSGLSCRDLAPKGYTYADAVAYWRHEGTPHRMDEDGDGLPCEGVYPSTDVDAFWGITD